MIDVVDVSYVIDCVVAVAVSASVIFVCDEAANSMQRVKRIKKFDAPLNK